MSHPTLQLTGLTTEFASRTGPVAAVSDVSLRLEAGQVLGIVGESGSGKSVTGYSIMRLIEPPGRIVAGEIQFKGRDLLSLSEEEMRELRGDRIALVFQDPMMTLNPVLRIDTQMIETVQAHRAVSRKEALKQTRRALELVGIPDPEARLKCYPHQLSGGMRQRVAIAIAMLHKPDLVIADEPTTALDVTIQGQILAEMQALVKETGTSLIWITHDLAVVAGLADRVAVMYAGRIVEEGTVDEVLERPVHPYTRGLIDSVPGRAQRGESLQPIPGTTPVLSNLPAGCSFRSRCSRATAICEVAPVPIQMAESHWARCHHAAPGGHPIHEHSEKVAP